MATPQPASAETPTELTVRPKVLRRPAQFSPGNKPSLAQPTTPMLLPPEPAPTTPAPKAWQDDGRFAIILIALVILMNIVVTLWLATIEHRRDKHPLNPFAASETTDTGEAPADTIHVLDALVPEANEQ